MKEEYNDDEVESSFERGQQSGSNDGLIKLIVTGLIIVGVVFWIFQDLQPLQENIDYTEEEYSVESEEIALIEEAEESIVALEENLAEEIEEVQTVDFFHKRALQRDSEKDYKGAVEDYEKTIFMAKKYSSEMWRSLNNAGIIKAREFKDYNGALKYFNQIIKTETNRYDGEINATRLEAGYTNRAYVKKMKGDQEGACDDLYEALSLGVESSVAFIEKQIDQNCL